MCVCVCVCVCACACVRVRVVLLWIYLVTATILSLIDSSTHDFLGSIKRQLIRIQQGNGFRLLALSDSEVKTKK